MLGYKFYYNSTVDPDRRHIPSMDGYRRGDELTLAYEGAVTGLDENGNPVDHKEQVFALFNAPWARPNRYAGPSMSVGDVVTFNAGTPEESSFAVARLGFEDVTDDLKLYGKLYPSPKRWTRTDSNLREYLKAKEEDVQLTQEEHDFFYGPFNGYTEDDLNEARLDQEDDLAKTETSTELVCNLFDVSILIGLTEEGAAYALGQKPELSAGLRGFQMTPYFNSLEKLEDFCFYYQERFQKLASSEDYFPPDATSWDIHARKTTS